MTIIESMNGDEILRLTNYGRKQLLVTGNDGYFPIEPVNRGDHRWGDGAFDGATRNFHPELRHVDLTLTFLLLLLLYRKMR